MPVNVVESTVDVEPINTNVSDVACGDETVVVVVVVASFEAVVMTTEDDVVAPSVVTGHGGNSQFKVKMRCCVVPSDIKKDLLSNDASVFDSINNTWTDTSRWRTRIAWNHADVHSDRHFLLNQSPFLIRSLLSF